TKCGNGIGQIALSFDKLSPGAFGFTIDPAKVAFAISQRRSQHSIIGRERNSPRQGIARKLPIRLSDAREVCAIVRNDSICKSGGSSTQGSSKSVRTDAEHGPLRQVVVLIPRFSYLFEPLRRGCRCNPVGRPPDSSLILPDPDQDEEQRDRGIYLRLGADQ